MGFCNCVNKIFLFSLNFVVFAIGVAVISLASVVIHRGSQYEELLFSGILTLPLWTLLVGIAITILGFFGCCGALKEDKCMLYTYASIVGVLFVAEVVLGILVLIYPHKAREQIQNGMDNAFEKYGTNDTALEKAIDSMQYELHCCGVTGYKDWLNKYSYGKVPTTCCEDQTDCVAGQFPNKDDLYEDGCFKVIAQELRGVTLALGAAAIALALVQIFCICVACGLAKRRSLYV